VFEFVARNRCVLLLDEIDAIAKLRDDRNELGELKRVVISLLQSIDYAGTRSLLVAATNHPHLLDPALWRRFQVVWEVPLPTALLRIKILDRSIGGMRDHVLDELLGNVTEGFSGDDMVRIATDARRRVALDDEIRLGEAILLGVVERLRTPSPSSARDKNTDDVLTRLALALRDVGGENAYSFNALERLTGIPHSTLHHRARAAS
jgi:SpoVK/Ycf46/Vps4 family AAA+-type ATPase